MDEHIVCQTVGAYHEKDEPAAGGNPPEADGSREGWLPDPRDGVLLQVRRLGSKVRPRPLLLVLISHINAQLIKLAL